MCSFGSTSNMAGMLHITMHLHVGEVARRDQGRCSSDSVLLL